MQIIGKFTKALDWRKEGFKRPWVSRKFLNKETREIIHELRCDICGRWYNYSTKDIPNLIRKELWNAGKNRPFHCNSEHCQEYHRRYMAHAEKIARQCYPEYFV